MNFDRVTNPMMKAFFQRLSNQIDKSDIPDGGLIEQMFSEAPVEPDETQILKDAIEQLQQQLSDANVTIEKLNNTIKEKDKKIDEDINDLWEESLENARIQGERDKYLEELNELKKLIPEDGTYSIPQLIKASSTFTPEEGEVILRFLQTFVANKEGNTMEQIKAAQKNLEARKKGSLSISQKLAVADKRNTDLIKLLHSLYDIRFFRKSNGEMPTFEEIIEYFENVLECQIQNWSVLLPQTRTKKSNMKFFEELMEKYKEYLEKEQN